MTRKKVNLVYIPNDVTRKSTFIKRRKGLLKKMEELSILCGLRACAVVYGDHEAQPTTWPDHKSAVDIVEKFNRLPPVEQTMKRVNLEDFLRERIEKLKTQTTKIHRECNEIEMNNMVMECIDNGKSILDFNIPNLDDIVGFLDRKLDSMRERLANLDPEKCRESTD